MDTLIIIGVYLLTLTILAVYGVSPRSAGLMLYWKHRQACAQAPRPSSALTSCPVVTVQLPMFNELYVAERLHRECRGSIDYPKDKLEIQVLDDSTDETVQIAKRQGR